MEPAGVPTPPRPDSRPARPSGAALRARALALATALWAAVGPAPASGQPAPAPPAPPAAGVTGDDADGDYGPDNGTWNGLRDLFALARGLGLRPEMRPDLVWDDLGDDTALIVLYPRGKLDTDKFISYVGGGGRLVLADDFGTSAALLERLGLTRHHGEARAQRCY
ncbi:MAG: hypothetical protein HY906_18120, partial [Deltaproteobacteria bacterium]|nr:hypothetical protein [Deltaproteobacteria bacterium]